MEMEAKVGTVHITPPVMIADPETTPYGSILSYAPGTDAERASSKECWHQTVATRFERMDSQLV